MILIIGVRTYTTFYHGSKVHYIHTFVVYNLLYFYCKCLDSFAINDRTG
jgi:hypothetical protein